MDAITSFSNLVSNIPSWRDQLAQLSKHTAQKHQDFKAEYSRIVAQAKPRRVKSPSICSIHTNDKAEQKDADVVPEPELQPLDPVDISPFEAGNRYIYAQATKKRKPGTSFRSGASGPMKFRSKQMVVIYYDSYVQEQLESIVKAIGSSRNNLRKGKMAYTVSKGLKLPTLGRKYDLTSSLPGLDGVRSSAAIRSAPKISDVKSEAASAVENIPTGEAAFKQIDKELETCQSLCETAAHQFLRDGDCTLELDTVVKDLGTILDTAKATLETFQAEERTDESTTEQASIHSSAHTASDATLVENPSPDVLSIGQKLMPSPDPSFDAKRPSIPTVNSAPPMMMEIEVDDDDDSDQSSIEIDVSKFRMSARAGNRAGLRT